MISSHQLTVYRGRQRVIHHLSIQYPHTPFPPVLHIQGPNGSGKSTLITTLAQLLPYQGHLFWNGQPISSIPFFSQLGWCADTPALPPFLTVYDALCRACVLKHRPPHLPPDLMDMLDLSALVTARIHTLSFGSKKRLGIALACITQPALILLDEPTTGLDEPQQSRLFHWIADHPHTQWVIASHTSLPLSLSIQPVLLPC